MSASSGSVCDALLRWRSPWKESLEPTSRRDGENACVRQQPQYGFAHRVVETEASSRLRDRQLKLGRLEKFALDAHHQGLCLPTCESHWASPTAAALLL